MRHTLYLLALLVVCTMASCELETSGNGDLDGYWKLSQIDTLGTGGISDLTQQRLFWSIQNNILLMSNIDGGGEYLFRFTHEGDSLKLYDARYNDRENGDTLLIDAGELAPFGINTLSPSYLVEQLSSDRMSLNDGTLRLYFRKF